MSGILMRETRSYYKSDDTIVYVDKRIGASGERSAYQITYRAWKQVKRSGEHFSDLMVNQLYAEQISMRYLIWLYNRHHSWYRAVGEYNGGPGNPNRTYANEVFAIARAQGHEIKD